MSDECRSGGTRMWDHARMGDVDIMETNLQSRTTDREHNSIVQHTLFEVQRSVLQPSPTKRSTKAIGDRSEAIVLAALVKKGYLVSIPFGENQRYDLLADDGVRILKVQVKTGRLRGNVIEFSCSSSHSHRGGVHARPYFGQADIIAVYCPQNEKVYLVPEEEFVASRAHLRLTPPANQQRRGIRWASHFELA